MVFYLCVRHSEIFMISLSHFSFIVFNLAHILVQKFASCPSAVRCRNPEDMIQWAGHKANPLRMLGSFIGISLCKSSRYSFLVKCIHFYPFPFPWRLHMITPSGKHGWFGRCNFLIFRLISRLDTCWENEIWLEFPDKIWRFLAIVVLVVLRAIGPSMHIARRTHGRIPMYSGTLYP